MALAIALLAVFAGAAQATLIDFESFVDYQNLHGVNIGGVTLSPPQACHR